MLTRMAIKSETGRCFAGNLVRLRQEHGLSIKVAAAKLGVAESTWSQWETGKRFPPCHLFDHIVAMFGVPPCFLLAGANGQGAPHECPCPTLGPDPNSRIVKKEALPMPSRDAKNASKEIKHYKSAKQK